MNFNVLILILQLIIEKYSDCKSIIQDYRKKYVFGKYC